MGRSYSRDHERRPSWEEDKRGTNTDGIKCHLCSKNNKDLSLLKFNMFLFGIKLLNDLIELLLFPNDAIFNFNSIHQTCFNTFSLYTGQERF